MIIAICGSRYWTDRRTIDVFLSTLRKGTTIVTGDCRGVDSIVYELCSSHFFTCLRFEAKWNKYGRSAGPIRNKRILDSMKPHVVFAFHENIENSKGTKDMLNQAKSRGIPTILITGSG